jgi:hypothetical protein
VACLRRHDADDVYGCVVQVHRCCTGLQNLTLVFKWLQWRVHRWPWCAKLPSMEECGEDRGRRVGRGLVRPPGTRGSRPPARAASASRALASSHAMPDVPVAWLQLGHGTLGRRGEHPQSASVRGGCGCPGSSLLRGGVRLIPPVRIQ